MPGLQSQSDPGQGVDVLTEKVTSIVRSHKELGVIPICFNKYIPKFLSPKLG